MDTRRSKRTPKSKGDPAMKILKPKSNIKNVDKTVTEEGGPSKGKIVQSHYDVSRQIKNVAIETGYTIEKGLIPEAKLQTIAATNTDAPTKKKPVGAICKKQDLRKSRTLGKFVIDCEDITGEKKIDRDEFKTYLKETIKIEGKKHDKRVKVEVQENNVIIEAEVFIEKKYIKYLTKMFLKGKELNNYIRIVNGKHSYALKYFQKDDE